MTAEQIQLTRLKQALTALGPSAIAVSGGIDSLALAVVACDQNPQNTVFHAVSPAVPQQATARVKSYAARWGWRLEIFDAGEFSDPSYRQNPINRCFFCKGNLYGAIAQQTDRVILSGTNLDDLSDFRPGLMAAKDFAVRHPYVEAEIDKSGIRAIARHLGLADIAQLPAAPCLSSRVKTGISIKPDDLRVIEAVEAAIQPLLGAVAARCRLNEAGFYIEIDAATLAQLDGDARAQIIAVATAKLRPADQMGPLRPYKMGSAFVKVPAR